MIDPSQAPLVISYYTENTPHQLEILSLIDSCNAMGIEAEIQGLPCRGSWEHNCAFKPFFIREKLLEKKRPVFWVDADGVFKKRPDFSFLLQHDLAFREMKKFSSDRRFKYLSASLFLNYTPQALEFMDKWCQECQIRMDRKEDLLMLDQISLFDLIEKGLNVKIFSLPISYAKIFDLDALEIEKGEIVIEHYLASRRFKNWRSS